MRVLSYKPFDLVANRIISFYHPGVALKPNDKFKCPRCGSGRTQPLSIVIAGGTRRRRTIGMSTRSLWGSKSTYKTDLVSSLPQRPSNGIAYLLIFLGACGLVFALLVGSADKNATGIAVGVGVVSVVFLLAGIRLKKTPEQLSAAQASWDKRWMCVRCGYLWEGA